jgi:hypothetical protein
MMKRSFQNYFSQQYHNGECVSKLPSEPISQCPLNLFPQMRLNFLKLAWKLQKYGSDFFSSYVGIGHFSQVILENGPLAAQTNDALASSTWTLMRPLG